MAVHRFQVHRIRTRLLNDARAFAAQGSVSDATQCYSTHLALGSCGIEPLQEYASLILAESSDAASLSTAMGLLEAALQQGCNDPETRMQYVRTAFQLGHFQSAMSELRRMQGDLSTSEQFTILGTCHAQLSEVEPAREAFQTALEIDEQNVNAWHGLIQIAEQEEGTEAALQLAEKMRRDRPATSRCNRACSCSLRLRSKKSAGATNRRSSSRRAPILPSRRVISKRNRRR